MFFQYSKALKQLDLINKDIYIINEMNIYYKYEVKG